MMFDKINALLLTGGKTKISLRKFCRKENKALIEITPDNTPMIIQVISAFKKAKHIDKIIVAGPEEVQILVKDWVNFVISGGQTIMDTVKSGLQLLQKDYHVLISACDIPLITEEHIDSFIETCNKYPGFDLYFPIIEKELYQNLFPSPSLKRIYANLAEGSFTGGNIYLVNPQIFNEFGDIINNFIYFRKHPLKMARLLGPHITIKYLRKYLSVKDLEKKFSELFEGYKGKAIPAPPEIALDIDKPAHLRKIREMFARKATRIT